MTKVLAVEWGPHGVRVNGIVPGAIAGTEGFERLGNLALMNNKDATSKARDNKSSSGMMDKGLGGMPIPMQRMGEVEDIANAALYLAGPASTYVSGWNLVVDGGSWLTVPNMVFAYPSFTQLWSQAKL